MRRDSLDDRARVRLFDELAAYFDTLVASPASETEPISSEQYVRNVVEILYFRSTKSGLARQGSTATAFDPAKQ